MLFSKPDPFKTLKDYVVTLDPKNKYLLILPEDFDEGALDELRNFVAESQIKIAVVVAAGAKLLELAT